jgi:hypothetical protein
MGGRVDGPGVVTVVERALRHVLTATTFAVPADVALSDASVPTLSWNALPLGDEGTLPAAVVTRPGHAPVPAAVVPTVTTVDAAAVDAAAVDAAAAGAASGARSSAGASSAGASAAGMYAARVSTAGASSTAGAAAAPDVSLVPMGGGLVDVLAAVEVADMGDADLLDVGARWQEVISWATAMQSRALGEIGRRRGWTEEHNAVAAEISARLRVPQGEANKHLARGAGLAEHPEVLNALHDGLIDVVKADILLRSGNPLTVEERAVAITLYLPEAPDHTRRWLRDKMNEFATDLKGTKETAKHARSRRAVFLDPADNAMAWLSANLPATDAAAVWDAIEQAARTLRRAPGGTRTLAQARADALVAITTGRIVVPPQQTCASAGAEDSTQNSTESGGAANPASTTTESTTDEAASDESATDESTSAGSATTGSATTGSATDRSIASASATASSATAASGTAASGTASSAATEPAADESVSDESVAALADEPAVPRTTVPATGCTCGGCTCGGTAIRVIPVKPQIRITIAATTLLGLDDRPGHLHGYGPIPADLAAQIATDATWQRLLTDPVTGILTDYSTTTYQPGKLLRQAVVARDQTCCFPQCDRPAHFADLDHIHPFDHTLDPNTLPAGSPGQTRAQNLQPLCRAHHLAKTHHGWEPVRNPATGITIWTAPTGHVYARPAIQVGQVGQVSNDTTSLIDDTRARLGQPPLTAPLTASRHSGAEITELTTEQPTTEQQLRRFPDQPPF